MAGILQAPGVSRLGPGHHGGPISAEFMQWHPAEAAAYQAIGALNMFSPDDMQTIYDRLLDTEAEGCVQEADLAGIACPVLVVVGEDDPIYSSAQIRGVADRIAAARGPGAAGGVETVVLPCGHSTYYEMPAVFSAMVARLAASV